MGLLTGKTALITGAARGIGKAIAMKFAEEGANIAFTDLFIDEEHGGLATEREIASLGVKAKGYASNAADFKQTEEVVAKVKEEFGSVDILVNNAGIAAFGSFLEMDVNQWQSIIQTNVMGMYYVTKEVLPYLIANNQGDIFNVSSTAGLAGNPNTSAYSASKFAVIGMSESLMKEVRKNNIRVCTLTPSTIASDMSIQLGIASKDTTETVLQPEDFAELIVSALQLPRRALLKNASLWSTNP